MTTAIRAFSLALATGAVIGQAPTHVPADAFDVPDGLEVTVWAKAPLLQNPTNMDVDHRAVLTPGRDDSRVGTLADVIAVYGAADTRTIVFTATKRECDELCLSGPLAPLSPQPLHGDVSQNNREVTLRKFREGFFNVLVATDVAAP